MITYYINDYIKGTITSKTRLHQKHDYIKDIITSKTQINKKLTKKNN